MPANSTTILGEVSNLKMEGAKMKMDFVDSSSVNLKEGLSKSGYTMEYVLALLHKHDAEFLELLGGNKIVKVTTRDISEGKGYCSRVYKTSVHLDDENKSVYTFMLKIPTDEAWNEMGVSFSEEEKDKNKNNLIQMHNGECDAYDLLKGLKGFPIPKIYYLERKTANQPGMIMMNDLGGKGASLGVFYSVTQQQCFNLARHMADFQVYVDFMPGKPWKGTFTENMHGNSDIEDVWKRMIEKALDYEDTTLVEKIRAFMEMDFMKLGKYSTQTRAEEIGCETLVHGDMWTNNMMIQLNKDRSVSDQILAIIDWQTTFQGSPLFDVTRFITNCADAEIRRDCERKVVDAYYDYLTERYQAHGAKPRMTREEAHELYDLAFVQEAALLCIMFAIMGAPLKDSKCGIEVAKCRKLALRLNLLLDDAFIIMDKYGMREKFRA